MTVAPGPDAGSSAWKDNAPASAGEYPRMSRIDSLISETTPPAVTRMAMVRLFLAIRSYIATASVSEAVRSSTRVSRES